MLKDVSTNKRVLGALVFVVLLVGFGTLTLLHRTPVQTRKESAPLAETQTQPHTHNNPFDHQHTQWVGPDPHQFSQQEQAELNAFRDKLRLGIQSGTLSKKDYARLSREQEATLATQGMSPFEALQYILYSPNIRAPNTYLRALADQALAENPEAPEVLHEWAMLQPYVLEGPNPEQEAAYEKILAMDDVPKKHRVDALYAFAGAVWYYKPEDAVRYMQEYRALSEKDAHYYTQGYAYERLGQYDKAMEVYRDYHVQTGSQRAWDHMKAIEAGTPYIQPLERPVTSAPEESETLVEGQTHFGETPPFETTTSLPPQPMSSDEAAQAADLAAQAAQAEFERMQAQQAEAFQQFLEQEFPEYAEFLRGPAELQALQSAAESNPLQTATPEFLPDDENPDINAERLRYARKLLWQYGPETALRRLRATDPHLAREIEQHLKGEQK